MKHFLKKGVLLLFFIVFLMLLSSCQRPSAVEEEICDGIDNDNDGLIDEGVLNACGECGPVDEEICDEIDNNCNGQVDEGVRNKCGGCGPVPREVCDNIDNDCNGQVDEGVTNSCGTCGAAPKETCDNLDNDCDGEIDEMAKCPVGQACIRGQCQLCISEANGEVCDGRDNDCDGLIDENLRNRCGFCAPEFPELCDGKDNDCDGDVDEFENNECNFEECTLTGKTYCSPDEIYKCVNTKCEPINPCLAEDKCYFYWTGELGTTEVNKQPVQFWGGPVTDSGKRHYICANNRKLEGATIIDECVGEGCTIERCKEGKKCAAYCFALVEEDSYRKAVECDSDPDILKLCEDYHEAIALKTSSLEKTKFDGQKKSYIKYSRPSKELF